MQKVNGKKIRSVDQYIDILQAGKKSETTLRNYRQVLSQYARFVGVPLDKLHENLNPGDLVRYASSIAGKSEHGQKSTLSIIHRYMALNGVEFDELEYNTVKVTVKQDREDKPLTLDTLQKMMDQGNPHSRALISFLISTGARAGETSVIRLSDIGRLKNDKFVSDINGNVVQIRNEIAKRKKGGLVFLTAEAREYLTIWLKDRERYIADANERTRQLYTAITRHEQVPRKDIGKQIERPTNDTRLFACSYSTIDKTFGRLYRAVDGERGRFRAKVTAHACRAFFRTHAVKGMSVDLVEGLLRHTGYLNAAYVRMTNEERLIQFRAGETSLYITRADHRIQGSKLDALQRENIELQGRLQQLERKQKEHASMEQMITELYQKYQEERQQAAAIGH